MHPGLARTALIAMLAGLFVCVGCSSNAAPEDDDDGEEESSACDKDDDCKGDRICNGDGRCVDPSPSPGPSPSGGSGGSSSGSGPGTCYETGAVCADNGDCCNFQQGDGFCVNDGTTARCADSCVVGSDCYSGCCAPLEGGGAVCSPPQFCP